MCGVQSDETSADSVLLGLVKQDVLLGNKKDSSQMNGGEM